MRFKGKHFGWARALVLAATLATATMAVGAGHASPTVGDCENEGLGTADASNSNTSPTRIWPPAVCVGELVTASDQDWYYFSVAPETQGVQNRSIVVTLRGLVDETASPPVETGWMSLALGTVSSPGAGGTYTDRSADPDVAVFSTCNNYENASFCTVRNSVDPGSYYAVGIGDFIDSAGTPAGSQGKYSLTIEFANVPPDLPQPGACPGTEPGNNSKDASNPTIAPPFDCQGTIGSGADTDDYYKFSVSSLGQLVMALTPGAENANYDLCVISPTSGGVPACSTNANGIPDVVQTQIGASGTFGTWYVQVHYVVGAGTYRLTGYWKTV